MTDQQPGSIRKDFANLLNSEDRAEIVNALMEYVRAGKTETLKCSKCGHGNERTVTDGKLRLDTLRWMTEQGLGRVFEEPVQKLDALRQQARQDIDSCTDDELLALCVTPENPRPTLKGETDAMADRWHQRRQ